MLPFPAPCIAPHSVIAAFVTETVQLLEDPDQRQALAQLITVIGDPGDDRIPDEARASLALLVSQLNLVNEQILDTDRRVRTSARSTDVGRRLMEVPGVGPVLASAIVASVPDAQAFKNGRSLAAWIGLVPRQNSSGGKERLGGITKQGDRYLRQLLVVGALAVIRYAQRHGTRRPWLVQLLARRTTKIAALARELPFQPRSGAVAAGDDRRIGGVARRFDGPTEEGEGGGAVHRRCQRGVSLAATSGARRPTAGPWSGRCSPPT